MIWKKRPKPNRFLSRARRDQRTVSSETVNVLGRTFGRSDDETANVVEEIVSCTEVLPTTLETVQSAIGTMKR